MNVEFKSFDILETKSDNQGNLTITGYGAYFNNIDAHKDIIKPGAFEATLIDMKGRIAFCYQHDIWNPIGKIQDIKEDAKGLWIQVMISAAEDDIQTKVKEGILREMSIGYFTVDSHTETIDGDEVRILTKLNLYEISLVTIASNPLAIIEGMKSDEQINYLDKEFNRVIAITRNEKIKFEIEKLKSLVFSVPALQEPEPPKSEEVKQYSVNDYLELLNQKNLN